jgi:hypothetical protein
MKNWPGKVELPKILQVESTRSVLQNLTAESQFYHCNGPASQNAMAFAAVLLYFPMEPGDKYVSVHVSLSSLERHWYRKDSVSQWLINHS